MQSVALVNNRVVLHISYGENSVVNIATKLNKKKLSYRNR